MELIRTMVVDDDRNVGNCLLKRISWNKLCCELPLVCHDGQTALEQIRDKAIQLVITDVRMPVMNGVEMCEIIHREKLPVRLIFMSAYEDFSALQSALRHDVIDYILKPLDVESLHELENAIFKTVQRIQNRHFFTKRLHSGEMETLAGKLTNKDHEYFTALFDEWEKYYCESEEDRILFQQLRIVLLEYLTTNKTLTKRYLAMYNVLKEGECDKAALHELYKEVLEDHDSVLDRVPMLERAMELINHNFPNPKFGVAELARMLAISQGYLSRIVMSYYGTSPINLLTKARQSHASHLLSTTDLPIGTIANRCGYTDTNYFSKVFKSAYGVSPKHYRQIHRPDSFMMDEE